MGRRQDAAAPFALGEPHGQGFTHGGIAARGQPGVRLYPVKDSGLSALKADRGCGH
jgi:hypothetical protein